MEISFNGISGRILVIQENHFIGSIILSPLRGLPARTIHMYIMHVRMRMRIRVRSPLPGERGARLYECSRLEPAGTRKVSRETGTDATRRGLIRSLRMALCTTTATVHLSSHAFPAEQAFLFFKSHQDTGISYSGFAPSKKKATKLFLLLCTNRRIYNNKVYQRLTDYRINVMSLAKKSI